MNRSEFLTAASLPWSSAWKDDVKILGNPSGIFQLENAGIAVAPAAQIVLVASISPPQKITIKKILAQAVQFPFAGGNPISSPAPVFLQISEAALAYPIYNPPAQITYTSGAPGAAASFIFSNSQDYIDCEIDMLGGQTYTINARVSATVAIGDVNNLYVTFAYD